MTQQLKMRSVSFAFARSAILDSAYLTVAPRDRIGVVAPNGVGKSTLLRLLSGELLPEKGSVVRTPADICVLYVEQVGDQEYETVHEYLIRSLGVKEAELELERASIAISDEEPNSNGRYERALDLFMTSGATTFEQNVVDVFERLQVPEAWLCREIGTLSGGQRARVALALAMLSRADVLLMDEPTNDLDLAGITALEAFVNEFPGGVVLVSHDRQFLSSTITAVAELDEFTHRLTVFNGGWDAFETERAAKRCHEQKAYDTFAERWEDLTERARREREWSRAGERRATNAKRRPDNDKHMNAAAVQGAQNVAASASRTERGLSRLQVVEEPRAPWDLRLDITTASRSAKEVIQFRDAVLRRSNFSCGPLDLDVQWADRIHVVGPNGSGKSTLLRAMLGTLPLHRGRRQLGPGVVIGSLDQQRDAFDTDAPVLEVVRAAIGCRPEEARTLLAKFRVSASEVLRPARSLSPGERTRAGLAVMQGRAINFLVLDEPTNHLDTSAIDQLQSALENYAGTLVVASHDRRLVSALSFDHELDVTKYPTTAVN